MNEKDLQIGDRVRTLTIIQGTILAFEERDVEHCGRVRCVRVESITTGRVELCPERYVHLRQRGNEPERVLRYDFPVLGRGEPMPPLPPL